MKTKRITIRLNEKNFESVKKVAEFLDMDLSSVLRNSLRFGLNALLKFETAGTMDLKKLAAKGIESEASETIDQKEYKPKPLSAEETEKLKREIEIANYRWLPPKNK